MTECSDHSDDPTGKGHVSPDAAFYSTLVTLLKRLERAASSDTDVIEWSCPVVSFGNISGSRVATVGINPSNREFVDALGQELTGEVRRFHTLFSLGLKTWLDADARHLSAILSACRNYFECNPYDAWFKRLDHVIAGSGASYYDPVSNACHLDLVPFATGHKWTELSGRQRSDLLSISADALALLVRDSPIDKIILNGRAVVEHFQLLAGIQLQKEEIAGSTLSRRSGPGVSGYGFRGVVQTLVGVPLDRDLVILGYNHNLQSSFGVTREAVDAIREWLSTACRTN